ncbi:hypothetical protein ABLN67_05360, partial [Mycobacterium tuberculosis]
CTSFGYQIIGCFNRFIYRREWVFAFIVKRFRVFRAPLQHRISTVFPNGSRSGSLHSSTACRCTT